MKNIKILLQLNHFITKTVKNSDAKYVLVWSFPVFKKILIKAFLHYCIFLQIIIFYFSIMQPYIMYWMVINIHTIYLTIRRPKPPSATWIQYIENQCIVVHDILQTESGVWSRVWGLCWADGNLHDHHTPKSARTSLISIIRVIFTHLIIITSTSAPLLSRKCAFIIQHMILNQSWT